MKKPLSITALFLVSAPVLAQGPAATTPAENPPGNTSQGRESDPKANEEAAQEESGLFLGADVYYGTSNLPSAHRFRDGYWLGYGPAYPSTVYGRYAGKNGETAKVALSVGKLYNGQATNIDQPVEAWYQEQNKGISYTAGKFYVPFELQEWEYETKWGLMAQGTRAGYDLAASVNYNTTTDNPNAYLRAGRNLGKNLNLGLSLGVGRGFSFDSTHDKGLALDGTLTRGKFTLIGAAMGLEDQNSADRFQFSFAKLSYDAGKLTPYLARHTWFDRSGQLGQGNYSTAGATLQITKNLAIDGAFSQTRPKNINWLEIHYTIER